MTPYFPRARSEVSNTFTYRINDPEYSTYSGFQVTLKCICYSHTLYFFTSNLEEVLAVAIITYGDALGWAATFHP
jgi:hypothetical protein